MFCSIDHMKKREFKAKIITKEPIELIKLPRLATMIKNIYMKMDIVDYHVFINLLINHINFFLSNILSIYFNIQSK